MNPDPDRAHCQFLLDFQHTNALQTDPSMTLFSSALLDECSLIVAHEFFDALPIYKFEKTDEGWRELVVDLEEDPASTYHFRFVLAPGPTQASRAFAEHPAYDHFKTGDRIEISPDSFRVAHDMAKHMNKNGGSALIVDYGKDFIQGDTLRVRFFGTLFCCVLCISVSKSNALTT